MRPLAANALDLSKPGAPLRPVFIATSSFLFLMALKFLGKPSRSFSSSRSFPNTEVRGTN